jgi:hypothetical protein
MSLVVMVLIAVGAGGCGEDSESPSTTAPATGAREPDRPAEQRPGPDRERGEAVGDEATAGGGGDQAEDRPPVAHDDSGGGAEEFRVPGGDNSVQEFGSDAPSSDFENAAAALHAFLDAQADGDWQVACEHISTEVVDSLEQFAARAEQPGKSCAQTLDALAGPRTEKSRAEAAIADVGAFRIDGDRGFLLYHGAGDTPYAISMVREEGRWKVAALAGVPLA